MFEEIDRPKLRHLPAEPFVLAEWKRRKTGIATVTNRWRRSRYIL
jgi:hypothetical protein